jgi:hypothetical protein
MAGIGKYTKGKKFQLRSGNNPMFKSMGSTINESSNTPAYLKQFGVGEGTSPAPVKDAWADALKKDPDLNKHVAERNKHEPGSVEYEKWQAKINAAHGKVRNQETLKKDQANLKNKIEEIDAEETNVTKTDADGITESLNNTETPEVNKWATAGKKGLGVAFQGLTGGLDATYGTGKVLADGQVVLSDKKKKKDPDDETPQERATRLASRDATV